MVNTTSALIGTLAGALLAPIVVVKAVGVLGFSTTGIISGSIAAYIMSIYGGTVTAGSVCAVMQSIGAGGLGIIGAIVSSAIGGTVGGVVGAATSVDAGNYGDCSNDSN
ncbi:hypothetical protein BCR41DRAFT_389792 [Lobosporangium transversale]|uniref:Uncharacterized protein n=1 Tax=Lobosporangium transversale TaxID=64571 RepID=A0A1Y2GBB3_9FUNG|nr:hypothetical protein BCR41DRAFT_389792 [Lobosporangium transversale]ORZ04805.1 hypothetical protein BCR41DRAFT_389792 [Lobosporangium transversale]|eukprot:XP_021876742.1 hypothetical protein BCR41DRAFT_389792 [Lobosporangium transversale]